MSFQSFSSVAITAPTEKMEFKEGDLITATVTATDPGGAVAQVEFYLREGHDFEALNKLVAMDDTAPYRVDLGALAPGMYFLTAVARDNLGAESPSLPVEFVVAAPAVLNIARVGNTLTICWPETVHGYQLEETSILTKPISWTPVNAAVEHVNGMHCVPLQVGGGARFFRLSRPTTP